MFLHSQLTFDCRTAEKTACHDMHKSKKKKVEKVARADKSSVTHKEQEEGRTDEENNGIDNHNSDGQGWEFVKNANRAVGSDLSKDKNDRKMQNGVTAMTPPNKEATRNSSKRMHKRRAVPEG